MRAEELGFVSPDEAEFRPLVVPVSAVLKTGKRAVAYVERSDAERPTFEGRVIELGPRAGDRYIVYGGLDEGERVVTSGNFKIDSALQIQARPSMMSPPAESRQAQTRPAAAAPLGLFAGRALEPVYQSYFAVQEALAADDLALAAKQFRELERTVTGVDHAVFEPAQMKVWHERAAELEDASRAGAKAEDIAAARDAFGRASAALLAIERDIGHGGDATHFEAFCPMAFDGAGGSWLQRGDEVRNPYFGESMLFCGSIEHRHQGRGEEL